MPKLSSRALKCTAVLDPNEIAGMPDIGTPRVTLHIHVEGLGVITTDVASKSLRKAQNAIAEQGTDAVAVIIQGKAAPGNRITEAGLVAQVKAQKPVVVEAV